MTRSSFSLRLRWCAALAATCSLALFLPHAAQGQKGNQKGKGRFGGFGGGTNGVEVRTGAKFRALFRSVVAGPARSTVRVQAGDKDAALGVVVSEDGYILTQATDLDGAKLTVKVRDAEQAYPARVVGVQKAYNLALLKVDAKGLTPVRWKDSTAAPVGSWVASVGMEAEPAAVGVVSVAARKVPGAKGPRQPPAAGGGFLGIGLADEGPGAVVGEVQANSAASKAGLKINDVIVAVGGKEVADAEALVRAISRRKPGEEVVLKVRRGEEEMELKVTLGKRPAGGPNRGDFQNALGSKLSKVRNGIPTILQHDGVVLPEDCGGPLVDLDGNVVGLNISRAGRTETWAIPSEVVRTLLPGLMPAKETPVGSK
jgi:serine protease Do